MRARDQHLASAAKAASDCDERFRGRFLFEIEGYRPEYPEAFLYAERLAAAQALRLQQIVRVHGWPGRSLVGDDGAEAAWLILQHADLELQTLCLPLVRRALESGEATAQQYAALVDRTELVSGKLQTYATHLRLDAHGRHVPTRGVAEPFWLDERRSKIGLDAWTTYVRGLGGTPGPLDPDTQDADEPVFRLPAGGGNQGRVVRVGDRVHRPPRRNSNAVQRLLAHLQSVRFGGAPRPLGFDAEDREIVSWIEGTVPAAATHAWAITEDALGSTGALIAGFRDAVSSYPIDADDRWFNGPSVPDAFTTTGVIGHNDIDFGNIVFRDQQAVALIDFDFAGPSDLVWEVAVAAYYLVRLGRADTARWPPNEPLRDRLRTFTQACRLDNRTKLMLWDAIAAFHHWRYERARRSARLTAHWLDRYHDDSQWLANIRRLIRNI